VNDAVADRHRVVVLGIGNILQGDDGVGVRAVELLDREGPRLEVELIDGGTSPFDMLGVFQTNETVIVVDCVRTGREPGTIYRLPSEALDTVREAERFAHGVGVAETVRFARALGACAEVIVLGVEPAHIGWSLDLSDEVAGALPCLIDQVRAEVGRAESAKRFGDAPEPS
jgi:hydrogenase maturation protease